MKDADRRQYFDGLKRVLSPPKLSKADVPTEDIVRGLEMLKKKLL
jgi:hypothetical protein